jgi:hypothetical protein
VDWVAGRHSYHRRQNETQESSQRMNVHYSHPLLLDGGFIRRRSLLPATSLPLSEFSFSPPSLSFLRVLDVKQILSFFPRGNIPLFSDEH